MSGPQPLPPQPPVDLPPHLEHGTWTPYQRYGCRCLPCQTFAREAARKRARDRIKYKSPGMKHGTVNGYNYHGCRCDACSEARRSYDRELYERNNPRQEES